jgi:membrane glycosyltransferase
MPAQDLRRVPSAPRLGSADMAPRRAILMLGAGAIAAVTAAVLIGVLGAGGHPVLDWATILLSTLLSGWVGFGFMTAGAGFVICLTGKARAPAAAEPGAIVGRTAILMPAYNEDPGLILSAVEAIAEDLRRLGAEDKYDLFILSDTRDGAIARDEAAGLLRLRHRLGGAPAVFYRRREQNTDRKAGNIADWVETHGGAYAYMLVLDADSLMAAETVLSLTAEMEADPRLGLLQTVPTIVNAETPFARLQQFASRLYGPVFAVGQAWWSGSEGNYWGHNAIIRVAAFAESAGLPHLTGPKPFGGHILSHDFIEAALLRRRGWAVRTAAGLAGSFEETPPTLLDSAQRDRRWCQGNLQHARVLNATGLHWVSRAHLAMGVFSYLAPVAWLALLALGAVVWPAARAVHQPGERAAVVGVFAMTLALLALPKLMAFALALGSRRAREGFGGAARLSLSLAIESVVSMLSAPVMMVMQAVAVAEVLLGRDSGWKPQNREGVELSHRDAWRAHGRHVALGVLGGLAALAVSKAFLVWTSPVFLSLALSAGLSLQGSRERTGRALKRHGLFSIPEEEAPPPVLARALELRRAYAAEAAVRRQIASLMREPVPAHEFTCPAWAGEMRMVA